MPAHEEMTQVEKDKVEIGPDIDFREIATRPFEDISSNEMGMFKWSGVYHQLQRGYFMIRISLPAGLIDAQQLRRAGELAKAYGQNQLCITTRQTLQFHWIRQEDIYKIIEGMQEVGVLTRNACGDVCRNVVSCSLQGVCSSEIGDTKTVVDVIAKDPVIQEQKRNLPRKHKIAVSGCASDCGQALMNCQGWYPVEKKSGEDGSLERGWAYTAGGGLGALPFMGQEIFSWVPEDLVLAVSRAAVEAHERYGNRRKRRFARLKITVDTLGAKAFADLLKGIMQENGVPDLDRLVVAKDPQPKLAPFPFAGEAIIAQKQEGLNTVRVRVPRSELSGDDALRFADLAESHAGGQLALSNRQNLELRNVPDKKVESLSQSIAEAGYLMEGFEHLPDIVACVGTTVCNLAVSDTPNAYRKLVDAFGENKNYWQMVGPLRINMNGCPNSCGQHWIADIGLRGNRKRRDDGSEEGFALFVGGRLDAAGHIGEFVRDISAGQVVSAVRSVVDCYLEHRASSEELFGDFARRLGGEGIAKLTEPQSASLEHQEFSGRNRRLAPALAAAFEEVKER